ncbi:MAG: serine hydrolase [Fimbriimonadaceae bacterium]
MRSVTKLAGAESLVCETQGSTWPAARSRHYVKVGESSMISAKTENLSWKYGGGGFESTAVDLAQFGQAVLDGKMMKPATRNEMWKKQTPEGQSSYGLGWGVTSNRRQHSGSQQGAATYLMINEKEKIVVCVMINTSGVPVGGLTDTIMKIYGG